MNHEERRTQDYYDIFVHGTGTKNEATDLAENIMLGDADLYLAVIDYIASRIGLDGSGKLERQIQLSAEEYKDSCILDGSDTWSES